MKKSALVLSLLFALSLQACKKKEDKPADTAAKPADTTAKPADPTPKPADPPPADPAKPAGTNGSAAAAADAAADPKAPPEGMPADCTTAYEQVKKYHACEKHPAGDRATMVKSWNAAVDGTFVHYKTSKGGTKKTIEDTCTSMVKTFAMLVEGC